MLRNDIFNIVYAENINTDTNLLITKKDLHFNSALNASLSRSCLKQSLSYCNIKEASESSAKWPYNLYCSFDVMSKPLIQM